MLGGIVNPIKVSINQFYGIEINDFACSVAQTALWIAESQMMQETDEIVGLNLDPLPLKTYTNIHEGNALRMDWNDVIPASELNYIMGNPPFVGLSLRTKEQQSDMDHVFAGNDRAGRLDYVAAWYRKAAEFIGRTSCKVAFVSTSSISQGEQVPILWDDMALHHMKIDFAYRPFLWNSEAKDSAAVSCVIVGFSGEEMDGRKAIYDSSTRKDAVHINGYLLDAPDVSLKLRSACPEDRPQLLQGSKPWDGGFLLMSKEERAALISEHPEVESFIHRFIGAKELINGDLRYCLWLKGVSPSLYRGIPEIRARLEGVAEIRRNTKTVAVQAQADTPMLFSQDRQPDTDYLAVPETSSENRRYLPIGFMSRDVIASNAILTMRGASLYIFSLLESIVHMAWIKTVAGRLEMRIRYSPSVYNNFPWPLPNDVQRSKMEEAARVILDARALYPESSLADLYDELAMPIELRKAHRANDAAVLEAYGFPKDASESEIVARLFKMYQELTAKK